jgi:hypothetical protein
MSKIWLSVVLGVVALLGLPGPSSAQHGRMNGRGFRHGSGFHPGRFHPGFNRRLLDPRFGRFDRDFDRRFFDSRFGGFNRGFDQRFFDPLFNSPFFGPRFSSPFFGPRFGGF